MRRSIFFQAEDGIRDIGVTGVQTCALPIYAVAVVVVLELRSPGDLASRLVEGNEAAVELPGEDLAFAGGYAAVIPAATDQVVRSEERRVGKECRSRWSPYH